MVERNRSTRDTGRSERTERGGRGGREESTRGGRGGSKRDFVYHKPSKEEATKRSEQKGGAEFDSMFVDGTKVFKVNDGDNLIRIVPATWEDPKHFGLDIFVHWSVGPDKESYLCLKEMKGEPCPLCEERARAIKNGEDDYAKELAPKKRVLIYLIDRDHEKEGVQAWSMPWGVDRDINSLIVDRSGEVLCIDDPDNGYDIEFKKKGTGIKTEYIGLQIARRESDIGDDEWLEFAQDNPLPSILKYFSYDHISDAFGGVSTKSKKDDDDFEGQDKKLRDKEMESSRGSRGSSKSSSDELTWDGVHGMTYDELVSIIDSEKLDMKPEDSKDDEELADWVCEDLKISKRAARTERTTRSAPVEEESPRDKLRSMRRKVE